ncbi:MAG: 2Fe-2S iron-sulfur cluster binding domain-containing protein [Chitinophagaceae bacterium]|mgnify:FL=1|jgi:2Fe-2S ferredoxin|nr:2Fe-2S iron-sulfur cluster binding domain-containing protein [Chitinophagaceae bacterium]
MNNTIHFTVIEKDSKRVVNTYFGEYRNLMTLLKDQFYPDDFGECGGTGKCGTCVIRIKGLTGSSLIKDRNEPVTLLKMGFNNVEIRLACQLFITNDLNGSEIEILDM